MSALRRALRGQENETDGACSQAAERAVPAADGGEGRAWPFRPTAWPSAWHRGGSEGVNVRAPQCNTYRGAFKTRKQGIYANSTIRNSELCISRCTRLRSWRKGKAPLQNDKSGVTSGRDEGGGTRRREGWATTVFLHYCEMKSKEGQQTDTLVGACAPTPAGSARSPRQPILQGRRPAGASRGRRASRPTCGGAPSAVGRSPGASPQDGLHEESCVCCGPRGRHRGPHAHAFMCGQERSGEFGGEGTALPQAILSSPPGSGKGLLLDARHPHSSEPWNPPSSAPSETHLRLL